MRPSVTEIEAMDRAALIAAWAQVFGTPVPKRLSSPFLRRFLGFEPQAEKAAACPRVFWPSSKRLRAMIRVSPAPRSSPAAA